MWVVEVPKICVLWFDRVCSHLKSPISCSWRRVRKCLPSTGKKSLVLFFFKYCTDRYLQVSFILLLCQHSIDVHYFGWLGRIMPLLFCQKSCRILNINILFSQTSFLGGLRVTNPPIRLMCPTSVCPSVRVWFPDSNLKTVWPINCKLDMQVEHHDSLYGIAFGHDSCIAKWDIAT